MACCVLMSLTFKLPCSAQPIYTRIRSFGLGQLSAVQPNGTLIEGSNGQLYGVADGGGEYGYGAVFRINKDGTGFGQLVSFSATNGDGDTPSGRLCLANNGMLYGTTWLGGVSNLGTLYRVSQDGSGYQVLKSFTGTNSDGAKPVDMGLLQASDGALYGTTPRGGSADQGIVFRLQLDGSGFTILKHFSGTNGDGARPRSGLIEGADGLLYGTTVIGGTNNQGTVFRLGTDGNAYEIIRTFTGASDGAWPSAALVQSPNGTLYGTTYSGGFANQGTVFSIAPDGTGYQVLTRFTASSGGNPESALVIDTNGMLYGTTSKQHHSSVYGLNTDGTGFRVLKGFVSTNASAAIISGAVLQASDGALYAPAQFGEGELVDGFIFRLNPDGSGYASIRNFYFTGGDGINPQASMIEGTNGALYGTTKSGGAYNQGVVFRINRDGSDYTLVRSFTGTNGDGGEPYAGVIQANDGMLYGVTSEDYESFGVLFGKGTVFRIAPDGSGYQVLHKFTGGAGGANPLGGLLQANDGVLYGTTFYVGSHNSGTVFKMNLDGSGFSVLMSFGSVSADGAYPQATLIQGNDGALYGSTQSGGIGGSSGIVFKFDTTGSVYQILKKFSGADGASPWAPLLQGKDGALYGTTLIGGDAGAGTVFKLNTDGTGFKMLRSFTGVNGDGKYPQGALIQMDNGVLYGTTSSGGIPLPGGNGTVFQMNPDGTAYTVLRRFVQDSYDGLSPGCGLLKASNGTLYGTTVAGGKDQNGTIFSIIPSTLMLAPVSGAAGILVRFLAVPGATYTVESAGSPAGPWSSLGPVTADSVGMAQMTDSSPTTAFRFYRALRP
jgi:uncharacterized repeat protein (TIGR03803 family)